MKRSRKLISNMLDAVGIDADLQPGLPVLELAGDKRILIENHRSVVHYTNDRILVCMEFGQVCVAGCGLKLARLGKEQLVITGRIDCISLFRG